MIDILLSTYNGAKYLSALLESIEKQTYTDWHILVRDDGSTDNTVDLLQQWAKRHPRKMTIHTGKNIGCLHSFAELMTLADKNSYIMFADQDDIWLPYKIQHAMEVMLRTEEDKNNCPIVICTDLKVVNNQLQPIAPSLWEYAKIKAGLLASSSYLNIFNCATGCTMLLNKQALQAALPIDTKKAVMHDYWTVLKVQHAGGIILPLPQADILYRQHHDNEIGAYHYTPIFQRSPNYIKQSFRLNRQYFFQAKTINNISLIHYLWLKLTYHFKK